MLSIKKGWQSKKSFIALTVGLIAIGGGIGIAFAEGGGGGGNTGGGTATNDIEVEAKFFDQRAGNEPAQGVMDASIDHLFGIIGGDPSNPNGVKMRESCKVALQRAEARGDHDGKSRVVGMLWYRGTKLPEWSLARGVKSTFQSAYDQWLGEGRPGILTAADNLRDIPAYHGYIQTGFNDGYSELVDLNAAVMCIALNSKEPQMEPPEYPLAVSTTATVPSVGTNNPAKDLIHTDSAGSDVRESLGADVVLNYKPIFGGDVKQVTKHINITSSGDTMTPDFVPTDFGWPVWPAGGSFFFDVNVPKQGKMRDTTSHFGEQDRQESFDFAPAKPAKEITTMSSDRVISPADTLAAGMGYNAVISAPVNGGHELFVTDVIHSDKVFIGNAKKDDISKVIVRDTSGQQVRSEVKVKRENGRVEVTAHIVNVPDNAVADTWKMIVPTYLMPSETDYEIPDDSKICINIENACIPGDSRVARKVTPSPNKAWVLDEQGALSAYDSGRTNQVGADNRVFLAGDSVSAVVNGSVPAKLAQNLDEYEITDDWSDAVKYIDFTDLSRVKVMAEKTPGKGEYADVTAQFKVSIVNGVTRAVAVKNEFTNATTGLESPRGVKLILSGEFRKDYDLRGQTVKLVNKGSERWNSDEHPTNTPPVYTWTPASEKHVLGSAEQAGNKTHENINGLSVLPGQKLEYSVGVDLRVPEDTARGVKTLGVLDTYDEHFLPDKDSVEIWDSRDATSPKPVARKYYRLNFNDAEHTFTVDFTPEWIAQNTSENGENSAWKTKGWLSMRFTGMVDPQISGGSVVKNRAYQIINGVKTATEEPKVNVPGFDPHKEDLNTDFVDINQKTVVIGDTLLYRLTLDANPGREKLAYDVHKLGMIDNFDGDHVSIDPAKIKVLIDDPKTGADVTDKFSVQIHGATAYIFAKHIDSINPRGDKIKATEPFDLSVYAGSKIDPVNDSIIDQSLLGHRYFIYLPAVVTKAAEKIKNSAGETFENTYKPTEIVSNPVKEIHPHKDIVVAHESKGDDKSINGAEIPLQASFNYRLDSSVIPANRAYKAKDWGISDLFDKQHDKYTQTWAVYADTDVYDGTKIIYKRGDLVTNSETFKADGLFVADFEEANNRFEIRATPKYLAYVNSRDDQEQAWSVYVRMLRVAPSDRVANIHEETYNAVIRKSNEVVTKTPEHPLIDIEKYTFEEGEVKGDHDSENDAYALESKTSVKIGFTIRNRGDVPLVNLVVDDKTDAGMSGKMQNIVCELEGKMRQVDPHNPFFLQSEGKGLMPNESFKCTGELIDVLPGSIHSDTATVDGESIYSGKKVHDSDVWFGKNSELAKTGTESTVLTAGFAVLVVLGLGMILVSACTRKTQEK